MDITLHAAVVHELIKKKYEEASVKLKDALLDATNGSVIALANKIHLALSDKENAAIYGTFRNDDRQGSFPSAYDAWLKDRDFLKLTHVLMEELKKVSSDVLLATGGYMVFLSYSTSTSDYITAAMVKQVDAFHMDEDLIPQILESLNLKKLHQTIRINEQSYKKYQEENDIPEEEKNNYLSFSMTNQSDDPAKYFISAVGCKEGLTSAKATRTTYSVVKKFFNENDALKSHAKRADDALTEYFTNHQSEAVSLVNIVQFLSNHFFGDEAVAAQKMSDDLLAKLNSDEHRVPAVFYPSNSVLKSKKKVKYNQDGVRLDIDVSVISTTNSNSKVYWNEASGQLIFNLGDEFSTEMIDKLPSPHNSLITNQ